MALALSVLVLLLVPLLLTMIAEVKCLRAQFYNLGDKCLELNERVKKLEE